MESHEIEIFFSFVITALSIFSLFADQVEAVFNEIYRRGDWGRNQEGQPNSGKDPLKRIRAFTDFFYKIF